MLIIDEYRRLTEEMAVVESQITTAERELSRYRDLYKPAGMSGIDYGKERVTGGCGAPEMEDVVVRILKLNEELMSKREELTDLRSQRAKLEAVIDRVGSTPKKVLMYKIEGLSHGKVAARLGCSKRYVERVYRELRENLGTDYIKFLG